MRVQRSDKVFSLWPSTISLGLILPPTMVFTTLGPVIFPRIMESCTESRNQTSEFSFCQNYHNLALFNRTLQVNKLISIPLCGSQTVTVMSRRVVYM